jgi:hypothetical protein
MTITRDEIEATLSELSGTSELHTEWFLLHTVGDLFGYIMAVAVVPPPDVIVTAEAARSIAVDKIRDMVRQARQHTALCKGCPLT